MEKLRQERSERTTEAEDLEDVERAYRAWRHKELSLVQTYSVFGVSPDEVFALYKKRHPFRHRWIRLKVSVLIFYSFTIIKIRHFIGSLKQGGLR